MSRVYDFNMPKKLSPTDEGFGDLLQERIRDAMSELAEAGDTPDAPGFIERAKEAVREHTADLFDGKDVELEVLAMGDLVAGTIGPKADAQSYAEGTIWNGIMNTLVGNKYIERYWIATNENHFACTDACPAADGAVVWITPADAEKQNDAMSDRIWQERLNAIMVTAVDDHESEAAIARMSPDAARQLRDALTEALAIVENRKK